MSTDGKIDVLNDAIARMIEAFQGLDLPGVVTQVSVIAFGGETAVLHQPLLSVEHFRWTPLTADGRTPMGHAFELATELLEDGDALPSRSYQPNLVLVSDGMPTDQWQDRLRSLNDARRAGRALRFAVGVGSDQKMDVLSRFAGDEGQVVPADRVEMLTEFFRYVTFAVTRAVTSATRSQAELPTFKDFPSNDVIEF